MSPFLFGTNFFTLTCIIFFLIGGMYITSGDCILKLLIMKLLVVLVAVAVKAITLKFLE